MKEKAGPRTVPYHPRNEMIRRAHLPRILGVSAKTVYRWIRAGTFPRGIRLSESIIAWRRSDIEQWLRERETRRRHQDSLRRSIKRVDVALARTRDDDDIRETVHRLEQLVLAQGDEIRALRAERRRRDTP